MICKPGVAAITFGNWLGRMARGSSSFARCFQPYGCRDLVPPTRNRTSIPSRAFRASEIAAAELPYWSISTTGTDDSRISASNLAGLLPSSFADTPFPKSWKNGSGIGSIRTARMVRLAKLSMNSAGSIAVGICACSSRATSRNGISVMRSAGEPESMKFASN
ncbi:hypothetical protein D3C78_994210 [compost metagenome]